LQLIAKTGEGFVVDATSLRRITELLKKSLELLPVSASVGAESDCMANFCKECAVDPPSSGNMILRELAPEEADLIYSSYCLFYVIRKSAFWIEKMSTAGGAGFMFFLHEQMTAALRVFYMMAHEEFKNDSRMKKVGSSVKIELIDDALYFCASESVLSSDEISEIVSEALKFATMGEERAEADKKSYDSVQRDFDLSGWSSFGKRKH
jgi:hypothetical protein